MDWCAATRAFGPAQAVTMRRMTAAQNSAVTSVTTSKMSMAPSRCREDVAEDRAESDAAVDIGSKLSCGTAYSILL